MRNHQQITVYYRYSLINSSLSENNDNELTGRSLVTHALCVISSLFAFSRATLFNGGDSVMKLLSCIVQHKLNSYLLSTGSQ